MLQRIKSKELSDLPTIDTETYKSHALYLKNLNRFFLNHWLIFKFVNLLIKNFQTVSVLDIGTGIGDTLAYLAKKFRQSNTKYSFLGVDTNSVAVDLAKKYNADDSNIEFAHNYSKNQEGNFDVAIISQTLHHLDPKDVIKLLKNLRQKINRGIIISDLIRSKFAYWLVKILTYISTQNKIDLNDGPLSVLRSYSSSEIKLMLNQAGIKNFKIINIFPRKFIVIKFDKSL